MVANPGAKSDFLAGESCMFAFTGLDNCRRWSSDIAFHMAYGDQYHIQHATAMDRPPAQDQIVMSPLT